MVGDEMEVHLKVHWVAASKVVRTGVPEGVLQGVQREDLVGILLELQVATV